MSNAISPDLSACRYWRPSRPLGAARLGIIPAWNAVTLLNPAAADIWDLLIETADVEAVVARYTQSWPTRAQEASRDVEACLQAWDSQGLFHPPTQSAEQQQILRLTNTPARPAGRVHLRRSISFAATSVDLEIEDHALSQVIADLLVDFPHALPGSRHVLRSTGPEGGWRLYFDGSLVRHGVNLAQARGQIVAELVRLAGGTSGWLATAHGAVLTGPEGAVFLAGPSGAGKSTLSAGLAGRGWALLAEDLAAFDNRLQVCPMPFALSIKAGAVDTLSTAFPDLAKARLHKLGPRDVRYQGLPAQQRARTPQRPHLIADVQYVPDMSQDEATSRKLSPVETLGLFMNDESFIDFSHPEAHAFLAFVERTPAYAIRYANLASAERAFHEYLRRHRDQVE